MHATAHGGCADTVRESALEAHSEHRFPASSSKEGGLKLMLGSKHIKGSKERLFVMTQKHNLQTFGEIPFVKLQKTTTLKQQLNG